MVGCTCENWSLQDLSSALQDMHKDNKKIVVPMFQRENDGIKIKRRHLLIL